MSEHLAGCNSFSGHSCDCWQERIFGDYASSEVDAYCAKREEK